MPSPRTAWRTGLAAVATAALAATSLAACSADPDAPITVATAVKLSSLDPAAVADPDAAAILSQLYPRLLDADAETGELTNELADSAGFTTPTEYTVTIPDGLSFSNGNELTSSDVVFSFERQAAIPGGAATRHLLRGLLSVTATDANTVVFTLEAADGAFPSVLAGAAGAILDEEVFSADAVTSDPDIVAGGGFAGEWQIIAMDGTTFTLIASEQGTGASTARRLILTTALPGDEVVTRVSSGVALAGFGELTRAQHDALSALEGVSERTRLSGAIRLLAFDASTQPFGTAADDKNPAKALAVRQAVAALIDRDALSRAAGDSWVPEIHWVPTAPATITSSVAAPGEPTPTSAPKQSPAAHASELLTTAGIEDPVALSITRAADAGDLSGDAVYAELEAELEASGLFEVTVTTLETGFDRALLSEKRYPVLDVVADSLQPGPVGVYTDVQSSWRGLPTGIATSGVDALIRRLATTTGADERAAIVAQLESKLSASVTTIPLLAARDVLYLGPSVPAGIDLPELAWFDGLSS